MRRSSFLIVTAALYATVWGGGCAGHALTRSDKRPPVPEYPPAGEAPPLLRLEFKQYSILSNGTSSFPERGSSESPEVYEARMQAIQKAIMDEVQPHVTRAFGEWQGIRMTGPGQDDQADLVAEFRFTAERRDDIGSHFLHRETLGVLPAGSKLVATLETTLRRPDGAEVGRLSESEVLPVVYNFFLVFAMPFMDNNRPLFEAYYDLARRTLVSGAEKGLWKIPPPMEEEKDVGKDKTNEEVAP